MAGILTRSVAIVDDHPLVREAVTATCASDDTLTVCYAGESVAEVLALDDAPDLVLLDLDLAAGSVSEADARDLMCRGSRVIVVSALGSPSTVRAMVRAGVAGFVSKRDGSTELLAAIGAVLAGSDWTTADLAAAIVRDPDRPAFSAQERRTLELYASGLKLESVARRMGVQPATAKEYIDRIRAKYAAIGRPAPTKSHLTRNAHQDGILDG
jgi:DNA-binding NarL/FixJ family response regulator